MSLRKKIKVEKESPKPLRSRVERHEVPTADDALDENLLDFVNSFMEDFQSTQPLEPIDLTTPEGATAALEVLKLRKVEIDAKLRTARALKDLLVQQKP